MSAGADGMIRLYGNKQNTYILPYIFEDQAQIYLEKIPDIKLGFYL